MLTYDVFPLDASPERAEILSTLMRRIAATENVFADYTGTCATNCALGGAPLEAMCPSCRHRMGIIASTITAAGTRVWEVWCSSGAAPEAVGVISFTDIQAGVDAKAHYIFFDERLADKTEILKEIIRWAFTDHEDWRALQRLTIEIPRPFAALARHAARKLGFGGDFRYTLKESVYEGKPRKTQISVEGVKRGAVRWKGSAHDLLILGLTQEDAKRKDQAPPQTDEVPNLGAPVAA